MRYSNCAARRRAIRWRTVGDANEIPRNSNKMARRRKSIEIHLKNGASKKFNRNGAPRRYSKKDQRNAIETAPERANRKRTNIFNWIGASTCFSNNKRFLKNSIETARRRTIPRSISEFTDTAHWFEYTARWCKAVMKNWLETGASKEFNWNGASTRNPKKNIQVFCWSSASMRYSKKKKKLNWNRALTHSQNEEETKLKRRVDALFKNVARNSNANVFF